MKPAHAPHFCLKGHPNRKSRLLYSILTMTDSNRQIKQMVNFIMQEAHEKVNEIRIKVCLRPLVLDTVHELMLYF